MYAQLWTADARDGVVGRTYESALALLATLFFKDGQWVMKRRLNGVRTGHHPKLTKPMLLKVRLAIPC